jgi:cyclic lactone autoinducer peptide
MKGLKGVIVVATVVATAAAVSACRKEVHEPSLKLGAADVAVHVIR